jgi:hypothetical protein
MSGPIATPPPIVPSGAQQGCRSTGCAQGGHTSHGFVPSGEILTAPGAYAPVDGAGRTMGAGRTGIGARSAGGVGAGIGSGAETGGASAGGAAGSTGGTGGRASGAAGAAGDGRLRGAGGAGLVELGRAQDSSTAGPERTPEPNSGTAASEALGSTVPARGSRAAHPERSTTPPTNSVAKRARLMACIELPDRRTGHRTHPNCTVGLGRRASPPVSPHGARILNPAAGCSARPLQSRGRPTRRC